MRKPHVHVTQAEILEALLETEGGFLPDIAEHFDVSKESIRRKCDGLVHQGKLYVTVGTGRAPRFYWPVEVEAGVSG